MNELRLTAGYPVVGFPDYRISKSGKVYRWAKGKQDWVEMKLKRHSKTKAMVVRLRRDGVLYFRGVSWLVLETFVGPKPDYCEPYYLNGNKDDCRVENLEWRTRMPPGWVDKVKEIRRRRQAGETVRTIATAMKLGRGSVYNVVKGQSWKEIR